MSGSTFVVKWKTASGQTLDFPSTTTSGGTITGGVFTPGGSFGATAYGQFTLGGQSIVASSAFAGGTPSAVVATSQDVGNLGATCAGPVGIKTINLGIGTLTL